MLLLYKMMNNGNRLPNIYAISPKKGTESFNSYVKKDLLVLSHFLEEEAQLPPHFPQKIPSIHRQIRPMFIFSINLTTNTASLPKLLM